MVREFIDQAIKNDSGITITYLKDGTKSNIFHLNHVSYSPQYGKNYIVGSNEKWTKKKDEYVYATDNMEKEFRDSLIIRPNKGTATFVRYMW